MDVSTIKFKRVFFFFSLNLMNFLMIFRCNLCKKKFPQTYVRNILERAAKDLEAMDKSDVDKCLKYIEHFSQWLSPNHHYLCDVELVLTQAIGAGDPMNLQLLPDEKLQLKMSLCHKLMKLFGTLAAGN